MTESYSLPSDIEDKTGYTDDTTTDIDLQEILEEAHREMEGMVGRAIRDNVYVNTLTSDGEIPTSYRLDLRPVLKVERVIVDDIRIDETDYTIDKQNGTIDFDQSIVDDYFRYQQPFTVWYVPKQMKDLELWTAVTIMRNQEVIQVDDDQVKAQVKQSEQKMARLRNQLNRKRAAGQVTDGNVTRFTP